MDAIRKTYVAVFVALMLLLALTVGISFLPFRGWHIEAIGVSIALIIAVTKATLVVLYFMHIRRGQTVAKIFIGVALFWFGILIVLTLNDYLTRGWLPLSRGWSEHAVIPPP
jgi:cytochrome c oxidase subunit 4